MSIDIDNAIKNSPARASSSRPNPVCCWKLQKKFASDNYTMKQLATIICRRSGITAMLFKAVRSPVFGGSKKFDTSSRC